LRLPHEVFNHQTISSFSPATAGELREGVPDAGLNLFVHEFYGALWLARRNSQTIKQKGFQLWLRIHFLVKARRHRRPFQGSRPASRRARRARSIRMPETSRRAFQCRARKNNSALKVCPLLSPPATLRLALATL
jgi:hypothetical protein